jgi:putative ABC transport system permease protein
MILILSRLAVRNLRANWKHALAALLSLISGFIALALFENYFLRVRQMYAETFAARSMFGDLLIEKRGAQNAGLADQDKFSLTVSDQKALTPVLESEAAQIAQRVRFLNIVGSAQSGTNNAIFMGYGYDVESGEILRETSWKWNVNAGRPLQSSEQNAIILGKKLSSHLGCQWDAKSTQFTAVGNYPPVERPFQCPSKIQLSVTTDQGQMNAALLEVTGISDAGFADIDSRFVSMPLPLAQRLLNTDRVSMIALKLKAGADPKLLSQVLSQKAKAAGLDLDIQLWQDHPYGDLYVRTLDYLRIFRGFVMATIILIVAMSVLNTFMKMVVERTAEIGTLRALGFLPSAIVVLFGLEGLLLAVAGVSIGTGVGVASSFIINLVKIPYNAGILSEPVPFLVATSPRVYLTVALFLSLLATLTAIVASLRQSRLKIPDALSS